MRGDCPRAHITVPRQVNMSNKALDLVDLASLRVRLAQRPAICSERRKIGVKVRYIAANDDGGIADKGLLLGEKGRVLVVLGTENSPI